MVIADSNSFERTNGTERLHTIIQLRVTDNEGVRVYSFRARNKLTIREVTRFARQFGERLVHTSMTSLELEVTCRLRWVPERESDKLWESLGDNEMDSRDLRRITEGVDGWEFFLPEGMTL